MTCQSTLPRIGSIMQKRSGTIREMPIGLPNRPDWRISKMGYKFDANDDVWRLDGSLTINLGRMRILDDETHYGLRKALCRYAEELSANTTDSMFTYFNMYCDYTGEQSINVTGLTNWRASLTSETEYRLGALKSFLFAWNEWGYPGIDNDAVEYLDELTLKGVVKGKAVKNICPYSGPFTQNELAALLEWASNEFTVGGISLKQYAYFMTLAFTGRRSRQIRSLRAVDLICREDQYGFDYFVKFPRVKQQGIGFRGAFRPLSVNEDLYLILRNQSEASQAKVEDALGLKLPPSLRHEIPIFLAEDRISKLQGIEDLVACLEETPDYLHMTKNAAMGILKHVAVKNTARSERTGDFINFTSRRFRYTKGTNLARRGITGVALAVALDHTDTQNIDVYTANTEEMADHIDEIMAPILAPLAQAFAGTLIDSERDALRANDPHSRVKNGKSHNVGNCGTYSFCALGYRACYPCIHFQPWRDAPHEEVLQEVLAERKRQEELGISPNVIQSTDRLLLAVQQVILLCQQARIGILSEVEND